MSQARQWSYSWRRLVVDFTAYPYQVGLGINFHYWPCLFMPRFGLHFGPFKLSIGMRFSTVLERQEEKLER